MTLTLRLNGYPTNILFSNLDLGKVNVQKVVKNFHNSRASRNKKLKPNLWKPPITAVTHAKTVLNLIYVVIRGPYFRPIVSRP